MLFESYLKKNQMKTFQYGDKIINIGHINEAYFNMLMDKGGGEVKLKRDEIIELSIEDEYWINHIKNALQRHHGVTVSDDPFLIFSHYGWLVEDFLRKMITKVGKQNNLRGFSFMVEVFQSSLRYLCYIQISQLLAKKIGLNNPAVVDFFSMKDDDHIYFDYLNLLLVTSEIIQTENNFVEEINTLVEDIKDRDEPISEAIFFMEAQRAKLLANKIPEDGQINDIMDAYNKALTYWLMELSFLGQYKLVSIKEIELKYKQGQEEQFIHHFGVLHGRYLEEVNKGSIDKYSQLQIKKHFTFNKSILLFNQKSNQGILSNLDHPDRYLSLSPVVIDLSVYSDKAKQTPEIFYYSGKKNKRFNYAKYNNELITNDKENSRKNHFQIVSKTNNGYTLLNDLHDELKNISRAIKLEANG